MPEFENPTPEDEDLAPAETEDSEDIEVVAHSDDELPCGGNVCGAQSSF